VCQVLPLRWHFPSGAQLGLRMQLRHAWQHAITKENELRTPRAALTARVITRFSSQVGMLDRSILSILAGTLDLPHDAFLAGVAAQVGRGVELALSGRRLPACLPMAKRSINRAGTIALPLFAGLWWRGCPCRCPPRQAS
jgi:hypothetical protein